MKTISIILIIFLLYSYLGCFSAKAFTDRNTIRTSLENEEQISLTTKYLDEYSLYLPNTYKFKNETVYSLIRTDEWNARLFQSVKIPFQSIHKMEKQQIDPARTILIMVAIGGLVYGISSYDPGYSMSFK